MRTLDSADKFDNMTSYWRQVTSLCQLSRDQKLEDEHIVLWMFGGRSRSGFEDIEEGASGAILPGRKKEKKKSGLNRVRGRIPD